MSRRSTPPIVELLLATALTLSPSVGVASPDEPRIEIHKAERRLRLYSGSELIATYPVGLGFRPAGDKLREGDGATPEGRFVVCVKNPHSRYYLSLGINYPSARDAEQARAAGLISPSTERAIARAEERGVCPPWNTALGGEIFIHGRGSSSDWTLGCVALDDPEMKTLFETVAVGTEVHIKP